MSIKSIIDKIKSLFGLKTGRKISGKIKFFDRKKGFGFIISGKHEYFFHADATNPRDYKSLQDGTTVRFQVVEGKKGPQADAVEVIKS